MIRTIQQMIDNLYRLDISHNVEDYMIGEIPDGVLYTGSLLIQERPDEARIAIHLDQSVIDNVTRNNPLDSLNRDNFGDFCTVAEEISHFMYVIWAIAQERIVKPVELELQGEVDKFLLITNLFRAQYDSLEKGIVMANLFDLWSVRDDLSTSIAERYVIAGNLARRYCQFLDTMIYSTVHSIAIYDELRSFYRMSYEGKRRRIERMSDHRRTYNGC